jgi:uncharacterized protein YndB with AHSA1/START domain
MGESGRSDKTSVELVGDREILISRTFHAPARILFEAWTKAELVKRWWAPKKLGAEISACEADVRVGGSYRYVTRCDGNEFAFYGTYSEVTPPTRLVYSMIFEPYPDAPVTVTVTFEEQGEHTRLVSHEVYPSSEARAAAVASGMEVGLRETMDQLDELAASLASDT